MAFYLKLNAFFSFICVLIFYRSPLFWQHVTERERGRCSVAQQWTCLLLGGDFRGFSTAKRPNLPHLHLYLPPKCCRGLQLRPHWCFTHLQAWQVVKYMFSFMPDGKNPKTSGAPTPDVLPCSFYWRLSSSLSLQAVWTSQERRSASTTSTCSSLEFLMRKRASTNQTDMPRTSMSSTPSTDSQRDHYLVSEWVIQLYRWYFQTSYDDFDVLGIPLPFFATFTQLNYRRKHNFQWIIQSITSDKIVKLSTASWNPWWYLQMAWRQILTLEKLD